MPIRHKQQGQRTRKPPERPAFRRRKLPDHLAQEMILYYAAGWSEQQVCRTLHVEGYSITMTQVRDLLTGRTFSHLDRSALEELAG